ncbi:MAG: Clp1/GlmU family protein [Candidatus Nitrosocaldus sp.]
MGRLGKILSLDAGNVLLLKGRATVKCKGSITILGVDVDGREVNVRHGKILPLEAHGPATVSLSIEEGDGGYSIVDKDSNKVGTGIWQEVIDAIKGSRPKRVILVGATDTGKSTLAAYISNIIVAEGLTVGIVDSDIGQGDIAPPACMGSCMVREQVLDLRDLKADEYYFIGRITPAGVEDHIIRGVMHLINSLNTDMVIVNTDGYVNEQGLRYKARMVESVDADMIVILGDIDCSNMDIFKDRVVVRVDTSSSIQKSKDERIARRIEQYRRFLAGGREVRFRAKSKRFMMLCRRAMLIHNNIVVDDTLIPSEMLYGMFVALATMDRVMGFAILDRVDDGIVTMITNYEGEFDTVMLSGIKLTRDMSMEYRLAV